MGCTATVAVGVTALSRTDNSSSTMAVMDPIGESPGISTVQMLQNTLKLFGAHASIECSPVQIGTKAKSPLKSPLKYTLAVAMTTEQSALPSGTQCFINMVRPTIQHFDDVIEATEMCVATGLIPVPHVPACRFDDLETMERVLSQLNSAGALTALLVGGNDQQERLSKGAIFSSAGQMLETGAFERQGICSVVFAGHPEGHAGLGRNAEATLKILSNKVRTALSAGYQVGVATQFCFDARILVKWLSTTRAALSQVRSSVEAEKGQPLPAVVFYVSIFGPTPESKLRR